VTSHNAQEYRRGSSGSVPDEFDDVSDDWNDAEATQRAFLNILEDATEEKAMLADVQRAFLNILEDSDIERVNSELANAGLRHEIAERARAEAALRHANAAADAANKDLEAFSYSVAHDLRAPLRGIDGFSQALVEDCSDDLSPEGLTYIGHLRESALHMARLIDGLLTLSRMGRGGMDRGPTDLAAIARAVFARLTRDFPERLVELVIPAKLPAVGDARMLEILLENLLENAWKFTSHRDQARIEVGQLPDDGQPVFFVRDNGAGFDAAYAGKLFAVFQRLHSASEFEGTGIGLASVERIVRRHGGRVWGEGEVGSGATFYFTLKEDA
jgi:light-regulated signal transduction histidine kinase (bacteriophytochrome)